MIRYLLFSVLFLLIANPIYGADEKIIIRVGHFPNVTHAQGVLGQLFTTNELDKGWFEKRLGPNVEVQWFVYNAGPSAMEAIFAGSIDMAYVGPSPAINAYLKSKGEEIRIVCGACSGGAALVVNPDGRFKNIESFKGKRIATPQLGNTQDVAARAWLLSKGFNITLTGGDVFVIPTPNSEILPLFQSGDLDGVWTIEPWVSELVLQANAQVYLEESSLWPQTRGKYVTTELVSSRKFLSEHPDLVKKWISAHIDLTDWINSHPKLAQKLISSEIKQEVAGRALPPKIIQRAWKHIELTYDPIPASLFKMAEQAYKVGFLKEKPDLSRIYDLTLLKQVLKEKNKQAL